MGDLIPLTLPKPWRRWLLVGGGVVVLVVVAYLAGKFSNPAKVGEKTVTVEKVVRDEAAISSAVAAARAEWAKNTQDHTVTKTRTVYIEGRPVETVKIVYVDRESQASGSFDSSSASTTTIAVHGEAQRATETVKVTEAAKSGWSAGLSALWSPKRPSRAPEEVQAELDRRLFGTLWVGARVAVERTPKEGTDVRAGAGVRVEF